MITVRLATEGNESEAEAVSKAAFERLRDVYRPKSSRTKDAAERQESLRERLVAVDANRVVGTAQYEPLADRVHIVALAVHPVRQRQGVATLLVEHLCSIAKSHGAVKLSLYTIEETGNVAVFRKLGFKAVSREEAAWCESDRFQPLHEVYMERPIS